MILNTAIAFPDHNIDPRKKDKEWMLQYAKAIWNNWNTSMPVGSIFRAKAARYAEIDDYAMGRQSVDKYKKRLLADSEQDDSWMKIDWTPRTDLMVLRNIAVAKLQKGGYNFIATPVNMSAADAEDSYYADIKAKIMMRDAIMQKDPKSPLLDSPLLKKLPGEPNDLEELEMEIQFSPKLVRSKDIEESLSLVCSENDFENYLDLVSESLVDKGVGILKEYLDENNKVAISDVKPDIFGCSFTTKNDFSDITWAFEIEQVKLSNLASKFSADDLEDLKNKLHGVNGNPSAMGTNTIANNGYDIFKADVLNVKFLSWNRRVTEERKDASGNLRIGKTDPKNAGKSDKYTSKSIEVIYEAKWIIGTEFIYDYKLADNMPRTVNIKGMSKTKLGYYIIAASFNKMRAAGLTEQMIPIADDLNEATYKLRNFRNRMVPNGFDIDLAAIESVALGKGGQKMTPKDVIDMFFETGILISRRSGVTMDSNVNYKAINAITNNMADQIVALAGDIQASKQTLRDITGLNELTDGSTPDAKTLTTIANLANESTNNALYFLINSRRKLTQALAKGIVQRLQIAIKKGPYDGFDKTAGKWVTIPKSIADYDYDIMIEDRPGEEQKQIIYQLMTDDIKAGYISHAEVVTIMYTKNLKHAAMLLSYRVEKGKERIQQNAIQNTQVTAQMQQQSLAQGKILDDKLDGNKHKRKMEEIELTQSWMFKTKQLEVAQASEAVDKKAIADIVTTGMGQDQGMPQQNNEPLPQAPAQQPEMVTQ